MTTNVWPTPQDYNEAIQNPAACFSDPDLKNGTVHTNALGLPRAMTGAFASVYKVVNANKSWAVRCFLTSRLDQKDRYKHISDFVLFDNLECTIDFHYVEEGIKVKGNWYPCLKMPWVEGDTLDQFLAKNYNTPGKMKELLEEFHKLVDELECAGIGHGDLQHGNIIVTDEGLRLVDYDALFVPALLGRKSLEFGHPNYQHPDRNEDHFDPDVDNFSCWLIHTSLLALAIDPGLYDAHNGGDDCILFKRTDLARPEDSTLFNVLLNHHSQNIRNSAALLKRMLWATPLTIPILDCPEEAFTLLPTVKGGSSELPASQLRPLAPEAPVGKRNRFDFIEDEAVYVQKQVKKASRQSPSQRLKQLNETRKKLSEDLHLLFSPHSWVYQHMNIALKHFDDGSYDTALNTYLRVYKVASKQKLRNENFFWCLMGLGYCSGLSDKPALAGNYFLLANKNKATELEGLRSALCLALTRFESGDESSAVKTILDSWTKDIDFAKAVALELKNVFIMKPGTFHMLRRLAENLHAAQDQRGTEVLHTACHVLTELAKTNSIQLSNDIADQLLRFATTLRKAGKIDRALPILRNIGYAAIKGGATMPGLCALFCALTHDSNKIAAAMPTHRDKDLGLLVSTLMKEEIAASFRPRLKNIISFAVETVGTPPVLSLLIELCRRFETEGFDRFAVVTMQEALHLLIENRIDIDERAMAALEQLGEDDIWSCLSETFLAENQNFKPLLRSLVESNRIRLLDLIGRKLSQAERTVVLSVFFMYIVYTAPNLFESFCAGLLHQENSDKRIVLEALSQAGQCFASDLDNLKTGDLLGTWVTDEVFIEGVKHLHALDLLRSMLETNSFEPQADALALTMMKPKYSLLLGAWMLKLVDDEKIDQLANFARVLIQYNDVQAIGECVLHLAHNDKTQGLEKTITSLKAWGITRDTLEKLILPAAQWCLQLLERELDSQGAKSGKATEEASKQLQAFYRLKSVAADADFLNGFDRLESKLFIPSRTSALAVLMIDLACRNQSDLLRMMAIGMASKSSECLENALVKLAISQPDNASLGICKALLSHDHAPLVVSLVEKLQGANDDSLFKTLTFKVLTELSEDEVLILADELVKQNRPESLAILIKQAKILNETDLLIGLLEKSSSFETNPVVVTNLFKPNPSAMTADRIFTAAIASDRNFARTLVELEQPGIDDLERNKLLLAVVVMCKSALDEYQTRIEDKEDSTGKLAVLAGLTIQALNRLVPVLNHIEPNPALALMQDERYRKFTTSWILDLASTTEFDKISLFASALARDDRNSLLETIFVELAQSKNLRAVIVVSRNLSASHGFALVETARGLARKGLDDAFGAVCLEIVTASSCDSKVLLELLKTFADCDQKYLKVVLRQISFYHGKDKMKQLCSDCFSTTNGTEDLPMLRQEFRKMGYPV